MAPPNQSHGWAQTPLRSWPPPRPRAPKARGRPRGPGRRHRRRRRRRRRRGGGGGGGGEGSKRAAVALLFLLCCIFPCYLLVTLRIVHSFSVCGGLDRAGAGSNPLPLERERVFFVFPSVFRNTTFFCFSLRDTPPRTHHPPPAPLARERDRERDSSSSTMFLINWCVRVFGVAAPLANASLTRRAGHPPLTASLLSVTTPQDLLCAQQPGAVQQERQDSVPGALCFWKRARATVSDGGRAMCVVSPPPAAVLRPQGASPVWCASRPRDAACGCVRGRDHKRSLPRASRQRDRGGGG